MPEPRYPLMSLDAWKAKAAQGEAPVEVTLCKTLPDAITKQEGTEDRQLRVVISDQGIDRSKDVISVGGWELDNYRSNPVVLFAHDYASLPIGVSDAVFAEGDQLVSLDSFAPAEVSAFADMVYQLLTHPKRFLRASSVGFRPLEFTFDPERGGVNFLRSELVEHSIVPVPDNPRALVEARALGIDLHPLKTWAEQALDEYHETPGLWVPRADLEVAYVTLNDGKLISIPSTEVMLKSGRVLSAKNESAVREAINGIASATAHLQGLLDALPHGDTPAEETLQQDQLPASSLTRPNTEVMVLEIEGEYVEPPRLDMDETALVTLIARTSGAIIRTVLAEQQDTLATLVRERIEAGLMSVTGRLD